METENRVWFSVCNFVFRDNYFVTAFSILKFPVFFSFQLFGTLSNYLFEGDCRIKMEESIIPQYLIKNRNFIPYLFRFFTKFYNGFPFSGVPSRLSVCAGVLDCPAGLWAGWVRLTALALGVVLACGGVRFTFYFTLCFANSL